MKLSTLARTGVFAAGALILSACADGSTGPSPALTPSLNHTSAGNSTVVVHPANLNGWNPNQSGGGTTTFVNGPGSPPAGIGSVEFRVGPNGNDHAEIRTPHFNGVLLSDITELTYSTYVQQFGSGGQAPYILLNVDFDNNGTTDDFLFFEPVYQNGTYSGDPVPNQCGSNPACVVVGQWQTWDARAGGWWTQTGGPPLVSFDNYVAAHPGARLAVTPLGSFRIVTGFGAGAWDNFIGNADELIISIGSDQTTYDFELQAPSPTSKDQCKNGGWMTLARANGSSFKNQGDCIQYVNTGK